MTTAAELASYASSFPSFRNRIINGNFDIWQRGESQQSSGYGSADRWFNFHNGSTKTASQQAFTVGQTDVPGNPKYYLHHEVSSVAGAGNYCGTHQRIEGVQTLAGQTATVSFWAKADSNKSIATEFIQDFGTGGSPSPSSIVVGIGATTHNLTTSWQKFTATVSIPSISGKTIGSDGNDFIRSLFWFEAGSDFNSRLNSLGQPNNGTTYEVDIAQVQLEEGTVATPFEHRPYGVELSLAQRYYQKIIASKLYTLYGHGGSIAQNLMEVTINLPVSMRSIPSVNFLNVDVQYYPGTHVAASSISGETPHTLQLTATPTVSSGIVCRALSYNTLNSYIEASAEL
jgi:hypothetical protein